MAVRVAPIRPSLAETNEGWGVRFRRFWHAVCTDDVAEVGAGETAGAKKGVKVVGGVNGNKSSAETVFQTRFDESDDILYERNRGVDAANEESEDNTYNNEDARGRGGILEDGGGDGGGSGGDSGGGGGGRGGGGVESTTSRERDSNSIPRQSEDPAAFQRPPRQAGLFHSILTDDSATVASATPLAKEVAPRGARHDSIGGGIDVGDCSGSDGGGSSGGGGMGEALWKKVVSSFWWRRRATCDCTWCRGGRGSDRWEYLVWKWVPLQLARSGDVLGVRRFLDKFPAYPDKGNLLRAAVRYKQYSLVEYFLDEQHMDVNLENVDGIPLVWFSVMFMEEGDNGVMLRYLLQKGANIKTRNLVGQTVLFLAVSNNGKEAIPVLKYLVKECGLSLTDRDDFGALPLHFAVLYGHMDTVQWMSVNSCHVAVRADWAKAFERMQKIRLVRPEHTGAVKSWRIRGLQKSARSLTPLGVAVLHNHEGIAKWLMGYGDNSPGCVVRKRENLFSDDNRDLALVAKTWPELLPGVLKGFQKKSTKMSDTGDRPDVTPTGWSKHTYDIRLLYGLPEAHPSRSPLNILLSTEHPQLFEVKAVRMVVALKWSIFGHRYYVWELGRYLALSASFVIGFIICVGSSSDNSEVERESGVIARLLCWSLTLFNLLVEEGRELRAAKSVKKYLLGGWNLQSVVAYVLVLGLIPVFKPWQRGVMWEVGYSDDASDDENVHSGVDIVRRLMTAPATLLLFTRLMEHLAVWRSTGIFIAVIRMMIANTASWSVLFILFEVAFALAFFALLRGNNGFDTVWESMVTLFMMSMGEVAVPFSAEKYLNIWGVLMFVTFMLLVAIVYLNLLVAIMTSGYTEVVSGANAQAVINRAAALVKWEGIMSERMREKSFRSLFPGKGKRSHVMLKGWLGEATTDVFCCEEGVTAIEPEQSSMNRAVDTHTTLLNEFGEMRENIERLTKHVLQQTPPGDADERKTSASDHLDVSFRRRQAGMLDADWKGLSQLRLGTRDRRFSSVSVSASSIKEWREKARKVQEQARSRRGVVRAQAVIRGYLERSKSRVKFLPDNQDTVAD